MYLYLYLPICTYIYAIMFNLWNAFILKNNDIKKLYPQIILFQSNLLPIRAQN